VCGGLAQYFNTDATLTRVLLVVLACSAALAW
jgi:phage shock protein PspC (stress-responsive transcriptional regulator)